MSSNSIEARTFQLPAETHVGAVSLAVTNLESSVRFYGDLLGFEVLDRDSEQARLGVAGKTLIELRAEAATAAIARRLGLYHYAILLPDRPSLGRCLAALLRAGIRPGASDHQVSEALYLSDPDGLGIEIYRDRPREEWVGRGSELVMTSDPLDFDVLLAAGDGAAWRGMPEGTQIGHVHFHVGDLAEARAFYHGGLGLDLTFSSYPGALFMSAGGYHHHVAVNIWAGPLARPSLAGEARLLSWDIEVAGADHVKALAERMGDLGYSVSPEGVGGPLVRDSWGIAVRLKAAGRADF